MNADTDIILPRHKDMRAGAEDAEAAENKLATDMRRQKDFLSPQLNPPFRV